jgi:hypothetical protein
MRIKLLSDHYIEASHKPVLLPHSLMGIRCKHPSTNRTIDAIVRFHCKALIKNYIYPTIYLTNQA